MKQAIVARTDLDMGTGKLAAQVAHASLSASDQATEGDRRTWRDGGQKKVVLAGADERTLHELEAIAEAQGLPTALIRDAGHTQLEPGTVTALAVGPGPADAVDRVTGDLSLL